MTIIRNLGEAIGTLYCSRDMVIDDFPGAYIEKGWTTLTHAISYLRAQLDDEMDQVPERWMNGI